MGKVKSASASKKAAQPLAKVKTSAVTVEKTKSKSKSKPVVKEVSSDEDDGSSDSSSDESEDSASDSDSASESGSDSSSDSESDSEASDSSSDDEEESKPKKAVAKPAANGVAKVNGAKTNGVAKANGAKLNGKAQESSDESSDSSESEEETKADAQDSDDSDSDSAESDSSDSDDDEEEDKTKDNKKEEAADDSESFTVKKRKALEDPHPSEWAKKQKTQAQDGDRSATLFVGNIAWSVDDDKLFSTFEQCEGIVSARVITEGAGGRSKGFGYVDFNTPAAANAALESMQGSEVDGRALNIDLASAKPKNNDANGFRERAGDRAKTHNDQLSPPSETLFVGNLPFDVDEDTIRSFFGEISEVVSCRLPTDPDSGQLKGFGYVTFNSADDAKSVLDAKNGAPIGWKGRPCRLDFASSRPARDGAGGGGGRGGRGGRGGFRGGRGGAPGGGRGGRGGGFKPRGGFGDFQGKRTTF